MFGVLSIFVLIATQDALQLPIKLRSCNDMQGGDQVCGKALPVLYDNMLVEADVAANSDEARPGLNLDRINVPTQSRHGNSYTSDNFYHPWSVRNPWDPLERSTHTHALRSKTSGRYLDTMLLPYIRPDYFKKTKLKHYYKGYGKGRGGGFRPPKPPKPPKPPTRPPKPPTRPPTRSTKPPNWEVGIEYHYSGEKNKADDESQERNKLKGKRYHKGRHGKRRGGGGKGPRPLTPSKPPRPTKPPKSEVGNEYYSSGERNKADGEERKKVVAIPYPNLHPRPLSHPLKRPYTLKHRPSSSKRQLHRKTPKL